MIECKVQLSVSLKEIRQLSLAVWSLFSFKFSLNILFNAIFHLYLPLSPFSRQNLPRSFPQVLVVCVALTTFSVVSVSYREHIAQQSEIFSFQLCGIHVPMHPQYKTQWNWK